MAMTKRQYVIRRNKLSKQIDALNAEIENSYAVVEGKEVRENCERQISEIRNQLKELRDKYLAEVAIYIGTKFTSFGTLNYYVYPYDRCIDGYGYSMKVDNVERNFSDYGYTTELWYNPALSDIRDNCKKVLTERRLSFNIKGDKE